MPLKGLRMPFKMPLKNIEKPLNGLFEGPFFKRFIRPLRLEDFMKAL